MRSYSIHIRRRGHERDRDIVLVKEGFNWPAFLFNIFWALWYRHWLAAVTLFAVLLVIFIISKMIGLTSVDEAALTLGWLVIVGMLANDVRRYYMDRNGFVEDGIAVGKNSDDALYDYLRKAAAPPSTIAGPLR